MTSPTTEGRQILQEFLDKVEGGTTVAGIAGLGYVGLPLAMLFAERGFHVVGFDIDQTKTNTLSRGESYIGHIPNASIKSIVDTGFFDPTTDFSRISEVDTISICVPTPLDKMRQPDLTAVRATCEEIAPHLRAGQLVILESTTYPGTTMEVMVPILETSGLTVGKNLFVGYSPEREDPANPHFTARTIPKVTGANDENSRAALAAFYGATFDTVAPVSSCEAAELTKLLENIYRCVNIALVNELKLLCQRMDIDVWEVIDAAKTKPFGFQAFYPGPGLGGHCIPIDPFYLSWKAQEYDFSTRFIELAGEINARMPYDVVERLFGALGDRGVPSKSANVLCLGIAYKKNVDDYRESPSLKIIDLLNQRGVAIRYHDPHVRLPIVSRSGAPKGEPLTELTEGDLNSADAVLILTDHDAYDYNWIVQHAKLVVDTRNATVAVTEGREKIVKA